MATIDSSPVPPGAAIQIVPDMGNAGSQPAEIADPITDMCATLAGQRAADEQQHLGFLTQEGWRHNFSISKATACHPPHITLKDNLVHTEDAPGMGMVAVPTFSRQSRLRIAAQLARSTACFQQNWLREGWTSGEIMFLAEERYLEDRHREPFLRWPVVKHAEPDRPHREINPMLSLGLALVELSLCRPIPVPKMPEGEDRDLFLYGTARRHLKEVKRESGARYAKAAETRLNWSQEYTDLDKEETQEKFFSKITTPLLEVVEEFEFSTEDTEVESLQSRGLSRSLDICPVSQ